MFKKIAIVLILAVAGLAGFIAMRPADFKIVRTRTVSAPPDVVHTFVNDFQKWPQWSPWEKLDANMKKEVSTPSAGTGATYYWVGNNDVGEGRMTITDSRAPQSVTMRLEFLKPFAATNTAQFDFAPSGQGTSVTWTMTGHNNFLSKAFDLFMNMDKMVGADFEKGLAGLDAAAAATLKAAPVAAPEAPAPPSS